ncbi:MAG: ADP-ribosylglycohydrolase family protein, partial [Anaerolineales bacterium]|nr:ADP-ribosylglycohydrolase family protein [Anaerolineales bacterium]
MLGAIAGDIIGSIYEHNPIKTTDFPLFHPHSRFTDDTVMSLAVARAILLGRDYGQEMKSLGRLYPGAGYGGNFKKWLCEDEIRPYGSWGNGSAMRVSPIGFAFDTEENLLREAKQSAEVSHNHPEGIKGAQAVALAILLSRQGTSKSEIRERISRDFSYDLNRTIDMIRPSYQFDVSCQGSVPEGIIAFLESVDYEDAVRKAVSLGGDSDTLACIAGGIAQAYYKEVPSEIVFGVKERLPDTLWSILEKFQEQYPLE